MATIVFLQHLAEEWLGVMYLSAVLKARGHACEILVEPFEREPLADKALQMCPDIIAFSCLTSDYHWALEKIRSLKPRSRALMVMGGTHITLNPEEAIAETEVDVICRGEGEYPLLELAEALDVDRDYSSIRNLWVKKDGRIIRNEIRNLVEDLDSLPFPDRALYAKYPFFRKRGKRPVHLSRGCPYSCSFCHNVSKKAIYRSKGKYVRWRSKTSVLAEIEDLRAKCYVRVVHFIDDSFGVDGPWLIDFLESLSHLEGKQPTLQASLRADMVTEELCRAFRNYGVGKFRMRFAVETGDEQFRRQVLKKDISNVTLLNAARLFNRYKVEFATYNIVGLPGESLEQALDTLRLNLLLKPSFAICFIYQPFPGTELAEYAVRNGYLSGSALQELGKADHAGFYHTRSPLKQDDMEKIGRLYLIFSVIVKFPFLFPLVRPAVGLQVLSPLLSLISKLYLRKFVFLRKLRDKY